MTMYYIPTCKRSLLLLLCNLRIETLQMNNGVVNVPVTLAGVEETPREIESETEPSTSGNAICQV